MAPSYANIFMGWLERNLLSASPLKPIFWRRYMDDIFLVWTHGRKSLDNFLEKANSFHPTIKFSWAIYIFIRNSISWCFGLTCRRFPWDRFVFYKPTDTFNYLHWSSCHPFHTKKSIPYSLAFRLVRICSTKHALDRRLNELKEHLLSRGFPLPIVDSAIKRALQSPRNRALVRRRPGHASAKPDRIPFVLTYNPALPNIHSIIHTFFPLLHTSDRCKKAIPLPPLVSYRRPSNLRNALVRARCSTLPASDPGFVPCGSPRCKTCQHTSPSDTFTSSVTKKSYHIRQHLSCTSSKLVYLITCRKCNKQYVGQTEQSLRQRMNSHRFSINHNTDTPVAKHFNQPDHSLNDLHIVAIDHLPSADTHSRLNKETFWIYTLQSLDPHGINIQEQLSFPIATRLSLPSTAWYSLCRLILVECFLLSTLSPSFYSSCMYRV